MADWDIFANYYDTFFETRTSDIPFWVKMAKKFTSPILELATGTGRIAIPIARAGIDITGIDISKPMLNKAKIKLKSDSLSTQKKAKFIEADVNSFNIAKRDFKAIFSTWGFIPITKGEQKSMLESVKKHLAPNGMFIIDLFNFSGPIINKSDFYIKGFHQNPMSGETLVRYVFQTTNANEKINHFIYIIEHTNKRAEPKKYFTQRYERIYTLKDISSVLKSNGFKIYDMYGNYDTSNWSKNSERTIILCRPYFKKYYFF